MSYVELKFKTIITKKPHRCAWCGEMIDVQNHADYRVYIFHNKFDHDWMHPECTNALKHLDVDGDFEFMPGEFKRGKCYA